jgi:hypothetical protein
LFFFTTTLDRTFLFSGIIIRFGQYTYSSLIVYELSLSELAILFSKVKKTTFKRENVFLCIRYFSR